MIHLNRNERRTAIIGILVLTIWAAYIFGIKPVKARIATLHRVIPQKQQELIDLQDSINRHTTLKNNISGLQERIDHQDPAFELLPHLELMLETHQLKNSVLQMDQKTIPLDSTYSENVVEVLLDSVTLGQVVEFIQSIEALKVPIQIRSTYLAHNPVKRERLNCTLSIHHPKLTQQQG